MEARRIIEPQLVDCIRPPTGPLDAAFICPLTIDEAVYFAQKLMPRLVSAGRITVLTRQEDGQESLLDGIVVDVMTQQFFEIGFELVKSVPASDSLQAVCFTQD